jgi:hypothetical protein
LQGQGNRLAQPAFIPGLRADGSTHSTLPTAESRRMSTAELMEHLRLHNAGLADLHDVDSAAATIASNEEDAVWHAKRQVSCLGDAKSSLGDAKSSLGDAKRPLGDAESSLGDAKSSLGDAESSLGDAKSSLGDAESSLGDA